MNFCPTLTLMSGVFFNLECSWNMLKLKNAADPIIAKVQKTLLNLFPLKTWRMPWIDRLSIKFKEDFISHLMSFNP